VQRYLYPPVLFLITVGLALLALGVVYVTVECQALPGFLGPSPGDTSPRTGLGVAALALGVPVLLAAVAISRRRT